MPDGDSEMMNRAREGDSQAYDTLVRKHQQALVNFFYKLTWDQQEAEDFAQDVFVKVYVARANYQERAKFSTYLFRVATNYWIDYLRTRGRRKKPISIDKELSDAGGEQLKDIMAADGPAPDEQMLSDERLRRTREAIDSLPEEQKLVFLLSETQGMKYQEIAETLDLPLGTVKSRIHAAVLKLRDLLTAKGIV